MAALEADPRLGGQIVGRRHLAAVPARFARLDPALPAPLAAALAATGVERLWSHQVAAVGAARRGEDVLVTTPTASGKSLVFQLPVLEEALAGGPGRALFLFPLKALAQDQKAKLDRLAAAAGLATAADGEGAPGGFCEIYDGDTPRARREAIRRRPPRVLVTNPDMLHLGLLAHWTAWGELLADLRWVVVDELHTYRGIFGSHFHHVLGRLLRLARELGARPACVASSATAGNAAEFAATLAGRPFRAVEASGAPREGRHLLLLRPDGSPYTTVLDLFARLLDAGLKTIVFTKARRITELLGSWWARREPGRSHRVATYRSGFLPEERRRIEADLFAGRLDGVISTSALEMGIDVGGLDACILVGYPGSVMATWQRSGRVGRAGRESLTALVALPDALDQYFLDHPDELVGRPCERLIVDPANPVVSRGHLLCAAAEMPLEPEADRELLARHRGRVEELLAAGDLLEAEGGELVARASRPHRRVDLRGGGPTTAITDRSTGRTVGTVDGVRALLECHPGAVYLHGGRQYLVTELDLERHRVAAERVKVDWYTAPLTEKETEILEVLDERHDGRLSAWRGRVRVTERVVGYERKRIQGRDTLSRHELDLPPVRFETEALWWAAPAAVEATLRRDGVHFMGALHASEHAAIALLPRLALCDRNDVGGISIPRHPQVGVGAVFVYDGAPGGVGIAAAGFADLESLLSGVVDLLAACPCEVGCPSCIQSPKCGNGNRPLDKEGARRALCLLLGREEAAVPWGPPVRLRLAAAGGGAAPGAAAAATIPAAGDRRPPVAEESVAPAADHGRPAAAASGLARALARWRRRWLAAAAPAAGAGAPDPAPGPARCAAGADGGTVLFDLETLRSAADVGGWANAHRMGVAVGVVCHLEEGRFESFDEARVDRLLAALAAARLVVGFNVKRFDYRVLAGYTGVDYARRLPTLDLLEQVRDRLGFRLGLGHLAEATLGVGKTADGLQSLAWVREGRLDLVADYCRHDVEILRDLYLHGRREGCLWYHDRRRERKLKLRVTW